MLARDLQSIVLYDKEGKFAGVRRPNSKLPINIDGNEIVIVDAIGSSGLDLKRLIRVCQLYMLDLVL
ncbi:cytochrome c biogenesis protein CCS1, chloroplastic [Senna tora]|uniref:Cytochrome c biogenesis protein CCS1, chloroplastic n=1 Tax=Senna tora TaxID=362788 RepID=A0A834XAH8_9FABA|nr:cytochrome c biogenesis protein CCS1, chloroplastic [Senna tora]